MNIDPRNLSTASLAYQQLKRMLIESEGLTDGDQTLLDTLEGETDLQELCVAACREAERAAAMSAAMSNIIANNQARKRRHDDRCDTIRAAVAEAMLEAGLKNITAPDMTISASISGGSVRIVNDDLLPDDLVVMTRRADKAAIKRALLSGRTVPGAEMSNGAPAIRITTK